MVLEYVNLIDNTLNMAFILHEKIKLEICIYTHLHVPTYSYGYIFAIWLLTRNELLKCCHCFLLPWSVKLPSATYFNLFLLLTLLFTYRTFSGMNTDLFFNLVECLSVEFPQIWGTLFMSLLETIVLWLLILANYIIWLCMFILSVIIFY